MSRVDLFRPYVSAEARMEAQRALLPDEETGRLFIGQGHKVDEFERRLQDVLGCYEPPLTTNSCTSAIDLALHLCGVGPGDYVITTPMTCSATNTHIVLRGAQPLWADVDPLTGLIDSESVRQLVVYTPLSRLKAVIAVDWGGRSCDYDSLRQVCEEVGDLPIIEDAAHAFLARYKGQHLAQGGGDYICWSFQAIKHLTTVDGGALLCPPDLYERAKLLRWYGLDRTKGDSFRCSQDIPEAGYKYHMNDVTAAIGLGNLPHVGRIVNAHRYNARWYHHALRDLSGITPPPIDDWSSWWLYTILVSDRDSLQAYLAERDIASSPVHARNDYHTAFGGPGTPGTLPGVDSFSAHELAIPVGWWVSRDDMETVIGAVSEWSWKYGKGAGNGSPAQREVSGQATARFTSQAEEALQEAREVIA